MRGLRQLLRLMSTEYAKGLFRLRVQRYFGVILGITFDYIIFYIMFDHFDAVHGVAVAVLI